MFIHRSGSSDFNLSDNRFPGDGGREFIELIQDQRLLPSGILSSLQNWEEWIEEQKGVHAERAVPLIERGFSGIEQWVAPELLEQVKVVYLDSLPSAPVHLLGVPKFLVPDMPDNIAGITWDDHIFIKGKYENSASIHLHEAVHVVQFDEMGVHPFLAVYGLGLINEGYRDSPLEITAYNIERDFNRRVEPYSVEQRVRTELEALKQQMGAGRYSQNILLEGASAVLDLFKFG